MNSNKLIIAKTAVSNLSSASSKNLVGQTWITNVAAQTWITNV
jgi:hypothetical protein